MAFTGFVAVELAPPHPRTEVPEDKAAEARRRELDKILDQRFEEDYPNYRGE